MRLLALVGAVVMLGGCRGRDTGLPVATALSPEGVRHLNQTYSPDGTRVAYWTPRDGGFQLWVANADLSAPVKLPVSGSYRLPAIWSPDGSRLAAASGQFGLADVVVVPAAGGEATRVTTGAGFEGPLAWYPDGDRISYLATAAGGTFSAFVVSVKSGVSAPLIPEEKRPYVGAPSPDGSRIAYFVIDGSHSTIWVADSAGGNRHQLTTEGFESFSNWSTSWSPDSKELLYESTRTGTTDLWVVPIAGGPARQLTRDVRNDRDGVWSPDGKWVAFRSDRGRQNDIWVVPAAGGEEHRITDSADEEVTPLAWRPGTNELTFGTTTLAAGVWSMDFASRAERRITPDSIRPVLQSLSPDGKQVTYVIERGGGVQDIAVMPLAGGPSRTLVSGGGRVVFDGRGPVWSPDGSKIVYSSDRAGTGDIWVVDAAGGADGAPRQLTNWPGVESDPAWSTDSRAVYFQSDRDAKLGDLWKVSVSGGEPTRVTANGSVNGVYANARVADLFVGILGSKGGQFGISRIRPDGRMNVVWDRTNSWVGFVAPSGDSISALVEQANGKMQAMILPAAGGAGRTILGPGEFPGPWSSDGRYLLYYPVANGVADLGVLTIADGTTRRLTTTPENEGGVAFTPDGKTVVFRRSTTVQRLGTANLAELLSTKK